MARPSFAIVAALLFALLLGQAATNLALPVPEPCRVGCADDGPDGRCAPACEDACCANPLRTLMVNPDPVAAPARPPQILCVQERGTVSNGVQRDVFHVPRPPLA